ncbi:MAG: ABC transporter ATP-binding protein [Gammaproteobacteria bacterium]|nr:ABC transporter ATP-binding protein [Gammaproteobacteria bacterium]
MSSDLAIKINAVSKAYEIYGKPIDRLKQTIWRGRKQFYQEFKALDNISFDVHVGQTVGIVGSNGAGKSTLLQMICGTLTPTSGEIQVKGRIAALLELGAGFNPDFTGRENVFMSATILGLEQHEIESRFEKIADFADIGEFIEQPVKTYSSGMYVRLAFSVIAHVDADILVIDEALSVGDAVFTQKCMRFIRTFQEHGTLLFVSHDMGSVQNLCQSAVWLSDGYIKQIGTAKEVTQSYLQYSLQKVYGDDQALDSISAGDQQREYEPQPEQKLTENSYGAMMSTQGNLTRARGWKTGAGEIVSVKLMNLTSGSNDIFEGGERARMVIGAVAHQDLVSPILGFVVKDRLAQDLFGENTLSYSAKTPTPVRAGQKFKAEFEFHLPMLPNGQYVVMASLADGDLINNIQHHYLHDAVIINVSSSKVRWGLVGVPFERISIEVDDGE